MTIRRVATGWMGTLLAAFLLFALAGTLCAQSYKLPPKPTRYIVDQAGVINAETLNTIDMQLDQFERDTSNQLVVAIYSSLPQNAEIAQYATFTYNAWGIGQKDKNNGVLLMIFVSDRKMQIISGRGLESVLPDATCWDIITNVIRPHFASGDYAGGVEAGVNAIIAASQGEYKGTGRTVDDKNHQGEQGGQIPTWVAVLVFIIFLIIISRANRGGGGPFIFTGGGFGGGGGGDWGGGGGGGGGYSGGGFSGGGGNSAGGGAGGSW